MRDEIYLLIKRCSKEDCATCQRSAKFKQLGYDWKLCMADRIAEHVKNLTGKCDAIEITDVTEIKAALEREGGEQNGD